MHNGKAGRRTAECLRRFRRIAVDITTDHSCSSEVPPSSEKKFLVDGMLGSIARKLRILGFDTMYDLELDDAELLERARESGRILLTSDNELSYRAKRNHIASIRVVSKTERERLYEILSGTGENPINLMSIISRCSTCNGELVDSGKLLGEKAILVCESCGKNYWRGGHWNKLTKVFSEVNQMLEKKVSEQ